MREAERWGDEELQDLGRRLPWGALYFRPEAMGTFGGGGPLDGAGTDFAIGYVRASWRYHKVSAARLQEDLAGLPEKLAHVEALAERGVIGGEQANAADLQIGATLRVLLSHRRPAWTARGRRGRADRAQALPRLPRDGAGRRLSGGLGWVGQD